MAVQKHIRILFASLLSLSPLSLPTPTAYAQARIMAPQPSNAKHLMTVLEDLVFKIGDINRKYGDQITTASDATDAIETYLTAYAEDPLVLDKQIIEDIDKDTENLSRLKSVTPELTLFTPEEHKIMQGTDLDAIREVYKKIEERHEAYENLYERWQEKRAQATEIADSANAAYLRGVRLEESLADLLTSMPQNLLVAVYRFDYLWLDVATTLQKALAERANEADRLRKEYDRSIAEMQSALEKAEPLMQSIDFFQFQDALINANPDKPSTDGDTSSLEQQLQRETPGLQQLKQAQDIVTAANNVPVDTPATADIQTALNQANISNRLVREYVARLFKQANDMDKRAAEHERTMSFIQLGLAFAQAFSTPTAPSSTSAPTNNGGGFEYRYQSYEWGTNPDGSQFIRFLDINLNAPSSTTPPTLNINQGSEVRNIPG